MVGELDSGEISGDERERPDSSDSRVSESMLVELPVSDLSFDFSLSFFRPKRPPKTPPLFFFLSFSFPLSSSVVSCPRSRSLRSFPPLGLPPPAASPTETPGVVFAR